MHAKTLALVLRFVDVSKAWRRAAAVLRRCADVQASVRPDAATLRDLGLDASEWESAQAESAGRVEATRRRVVLGA